MSIETTTAVSFDDKNQPVLRLERRFPHPRSRVWSALTDPAQMSRWFPCEIEGDLRLDGTLTFRFAGAPEPDTATITELDPPRTFSFTWAGEQLRWTLEDDGDGCVLRLSNTIVDRAWAANTAAGWTVCFQALDEHLRGETPTDHSGPDEELIEHYRKVLPI